MISEEEVIKSYRRALSFKVRKLQIENSREETRYESEERLNAICDFNTLELQYEAQFIR